MSLLQPRFRISRKLGEMFDAERRNGIEIETADGLVALHIWKDGLRFYTLQAPPDRAEQIAELLHQGAQQIRRAGGSAPLSSAGALPPRRA